MAARRSFWTAVHTSAHIGVVAFVLSVMPARAGDPSPDDRLNVAMDEAKLIKLPERVTTIVVGNPLIADASLQAGGLAVLTGNGYGATNFIALDRKGNALFEKIIEVRGALNTIVVYKGVSRETYSCMPNCQPVIAAGDGQEFFNQTLVQTTTRSTQATSMSAPR
jgi:Flp pilus assembly secretin CpaC